MFDQLSKTLLALSEKNPEVLNIILYIILAMVLFFGVRGLINFINGLVRVRGNADSYEHNERLSLIQLTSKSIEIQQEQVKQNEVHQKERVDAQHETTKAIESQNLLLINIPKTISETIDLSHAETMNKLLEMGITLEDMQATIQEIKDYLAQFPNMNSKLDNLLALFEKIAAEMENKENVI